MKKGIFTILLVAAILAAPSLAVGQVTKATTAITAGEAHIGEVGGRQAVVSATITRPANTTAYDANDTIAADPAVALSFANACRVAGGTGYITKGRLFTSQSTNVALYRLQLYNVAPTPIADNSAFTLLIANQASRVGWVDIGPASTEGTGSDSANAVNWDVRLAYKCAAGSTSIFGLLETKNGFTPASAQTYFLELTFDQN